MLSLFFLVPQYLSIASVPKAIMAMGYNIITDTFFVIVLIYFILPKSLEKKSSFLPIISVILLLFFSIIFYKLGYGIILGQSVKWTFKSILLGMIRQAQSLGILLSVLAMKKFFNSQKQILNLEKANAERNLKALNNQIAPHFLFNNLNVLQSLIQINPNQASIYVGHLSSLYRYLITHKDEDVVLLKDELTFAESYIYLLSQRFGKAYNFDIKIIDEKALNKLVPTCCLQTLLENIIKHNQGNEDAPLLTIIHINIDEIVVENEINIKINLGDSSGTGLQNLKERYLLLSDKHILVQANTRFKVSLPLLNQTSQLN